MTVARTRSVALVGLVGHVVEVEADIGRGLPAFTLVGLPDTALSESRDRIRAAVLNSGEPWPVHRITVNLSPAWLPKAGSGFDLALAGCVLAASGRVDVASVAQLVLLGELGLDGRVRAVRGVLPAVLAAARAGAREVVVPAANAAEAAIVPEVRVRAVTRLAGLIALLRGEPPLDDDEPVETAAGVAGPPAGAPHVGDLAEVAGQVEARFALEVAAAGGHHVLLHGPPGSGKTMLAERLPSVLPDLDGHESIEVTAIQSVAGELPPGVPLVSRPPFRAPHHTASAAAVVGGGSGVARPGAVSLAHRGVLFLDEAPEFTSGVLDGLRQPLESGHVVLHRSRASVVYPARFQLVLAANPCPCGLAGSRDGCRCTPSQQLRYVGRLSGPLQDRLDLMVEVPQPSRSDLLDGAGGEPSSVVAVRVAQARERASRRWSGLPWTTNAAVPGSELRGPSWRLSGADLRGLHDAFAAGRLSARGVDRVLRLAWSLADLDSVDRPSATHVGHALHLRTSSVLPGLAA